MDAGGPEKILSAHDVGHTLVRIVEHNREVIARRQVLARQHDVAPLLRLRQDRTGFSRRTGTGLGPR